MKPTLFDADPEPTPLKVKLPSEHTRQEAELPLTLSYRRTHRTALGNNSSHALQLQRHRIITSLYFSPTLHPWAALAATRRESAKVPSRRVWDVVGPSWKPLSQSPLVIPFTEPLAVRRPEQLSGWPQAERYLSNVLAPKT
jgi:hypothetical protein